MFQHSIGNAFQIVGIVSLTRFLIGSRTPWETERALRDENPLLTSTRPLRGGLKLSHRWRTEIELRIVHRETECARECRFESPILSIRPWTYRVFRGFRETTMFIVCRGTYVFHEMRMIVNATCNQSANHRFQPLALPIIFQKMCQFGLFNFTVRAHTRVN